MHVTKSECSRSGRLGAATALLLVLAASGCVDKQNGGKLGNTALYVFDGADTPAAGRVQIWDDVQKLDGVTVLPAPTRTLSGALLDNVKSLSVGGMAMDPWKGRLFLVSTTGTVVVVDKVRGKNGAVTATTDIWSFTLPDGGLGGTGTNVFGQATVDPGGNLYVTESNETATGILMIANAASVQSGTTASATLIQVATTNDKRGSGVAVSSGTVFGHFGDGQPIDHSSKSYNGPRLRQGGSSGFGAADANVVISTSGDDACGLGSAASGSGTLAFDSGANHLYVAPSNGSTSAVLIFRTSAFTDGWNKAPDLRLASVGTSLGMVAHPWNKDWLVGAPMPSATAGAANNTLWLWKNPAVKVTDTSGASVMPSPTTLGLGSTVVIRAVAFDGNSGS
jgi:hypothetical protein